MGEREYRIRGEMEGGRFIVLTSVKERKMYAEGPCVDVPDDPWRWSKLEAFRVAKLVDRAFRGHADRFDEKLP